MSNVPTFGEIVEGLLSAPAGENLDNALLDYVRIMSGIPESGGSITKAFGLARTNLTTGVFFLYGTAIDTTRVVRRLDEILEQSRRAGGFPGRLFI